MLSSRTRFHLTMFTLMFIVALIGVVVGAEIVSGAVCEDIGYDLGFFSFATLETMCRNTDTEPVTVEAWFDCMRRNHCPPYDVIED